MSEEGKILSKGKYFNESSEWELLFNGQSIDIKDGYLYEDKDSGKAYWIKIKNPILYKKIISHTATELMKDATGIDFEINFNFNDNFESSYLHEIEIIKIPKQKQHRDNLDVIYFYFSGEELSKLSKDGKYIILFCISIRMDNWKNPWTLKEHLNELRRTLNESELKNGIQQLRMMIGPILDGNNLSQILRLAQGYNCNGSPLNTYIDKCINILTTAQTEVLEKYQRESFTEAIAEKFNFPPEVKTACKQYLLYFTEFLEDMGIEAISSIQEQDGDVTFLVEPRNKAEALSKIANLLKIYLYLPSSPLAGSYANPLDSNLALQRLTSQIHHLNSQLTLATATIQQQAATIQQKDFLIQQQQQFIQSQQFTPQVLIDSMKDSKNHEEPLLGDLVKVGDYEMGPLKLKLPQLIQWLKEQFKK